MLSRPWLQPHAVWWPSVYQEERNTAQESGLVQSLSAARCLSEKASLKDQRQVDHK